MGDERSGWEEYIEYIFPDMDAEKPNQKLLAMAARWAEQLERKKKNIDGEDDNDEQSDDENSDSDVDSENPDKDYTDNKNEEEVQLPDDNDYSD